MGGSSKQVVGHQYYASLVKFIGFRIDRLIGVNFDNRKWIYLEDDVSHLNVSEPDLYGENEGGVKGMIDVHLGTPDQEPNMHYQAHDPEISGFPYQSYLVFHGEEDTIEEVEATDKFGQTYSKFVAKLGQHSFYHGNTNTMRDVLLWSKRTRVQNDGTEQWYKIRGDGAIVCEIGAYERGGVIEEPPTENKTISINYSGRSDTANPSVKITHIGQVQRTAVAMSGGTMFIAFDGENSCNVGYTAIYSNNDERGNAQSNAEYTISDLGGITGKFHTIFNLIISGDHYDNYQILTDGTIISRDILKDQNVSTNWIKRRRITIEVFGYGATFFTVQMSAARTKKEYDPDFGWVDGLHTGVSFENFEYLTLRKSDIVQKTGVDINPIHKIREILTNPSPWGMGKDAEDEINDVNFRKAADRIYDEGLGISWAIKDKDCLEAINELCHHIEAGVRVNRQTGEHEVVLFRDDWFGDDEIHTISESQIKSMQLEVQNADEVINHVNVKYYDQENIKDGAFSISENGLIKTVGQVVSEDIEFPYFMQKYNAELVSGWKLKQLSTPAWKGTFTTGLREARKWNRYDLIDLPWSKKWGGTIRARIMAINLGTATDNQVTIEFVEVVDFSNIQPQIGTDVSYGTQILEPQQSYATVFELPYYLAVYTKGQKEADDQLNYDNTIGYVAALAMPVQYNSINAALYSDDAGLNEDLEKVATVNYCDAVVSDQIITKTMHSFTVKDTPFTLANRARKFAGAAAGTLIKINDEFMSLESYDDATKVMTVSRGVLDTGVFEHAANSDLFIFDTADLAINAQQFIESDIVESKVLTTTPSGILKIGEATAHTTELQARAIRPYPPANVKFNGNYWIETHVVASDLVLTWSHRNRLEQTAQTHVDWYDTSVTLENGTTYSLELSTVQDGVIYSANGLTSDNHTIDADVLIPNKAHKLKLWSVRDGFESYSFFEHSFFAEAVSLILTATVTSNSASGNTVPTANIAVDVDTSLKANMLFDGSRITGKAPANSTITIEIED